MDTANQYNLFFEVSNMPGFMSKPKIKTPYINGTPKNHEVASFIESNGLEITQNIIDEINSFNYDNSFQGYEVWGYNDTENVEIRNILPAAAITVFNTRNIEVIIPLADFLQILNEWKAFLSSIPLPHWLDNR